MACAACLCACGQEFEQSYLDNVDNADVGQYLDTSYSESQATIIECMGTQVDITGTGVVYDNGVVTITQEGTYILRGTFNDGCIEIDASKQENIQLVFDNIMIQSKGWPCIYVKRCNECLITLANGTTNMLIDSEIYATESSSSEPNAAIFSKHDLVFNGSGTLQVTGLFNHGISSKADLSFMSGTYIITANHDGIHGRDSVVILDGMFTIAAKGDGIDATNTQDSDKGYVYIQGGTFDIHADDDVVQAESYISIAPEISLE